MAEKPDDTFDRRFHSEQIFERCVTLYRPVHENPAKPLILARIDDLGLSYRSHHALG